MQQVFASVEDAERFAGDSPDRRVSRHPVRQSVEDAVVIFDRLVVIERGATVLDRTNVERRFVDNPDESPVPADVEWFHDPADAQWHIAGFGIDRAALDAEVQTAIDHASKLSYSSPMNTAR